MDISIASNFERLIYDFYSKRNSEICNSFYKNFPESPIKLDNQMWEKSKELFLSYSVDDFSTIEAMKNISESYDYLIDPHTAVASQAVDSMQSSLEGTTVILSTAHPAKFPKVVSDAGLNLGEIPECLSIIFEKEERSKDFPASKELIFDYIVHNNS